MLLAADIERKAYGPKELYKGLHFTIDRGERVGVIGRNGVGKSTLFALMTGADTDFDGHIQYARQAIVIATRQEHQNVEQYSAIEYILGELPTYRNLKTVIDNFATIQQPTIKQISTYSDALEQFSSLGYYDVESSILQELETYQITEHMARAPLRQLSGGQKRFVELVKIAHAKADLALIDEPTNHMDFVAKQAFIEWLKTVGKLSVIIITHDRDVLQHVDRIIEIKDGRALSFKGNYESYLKQNSSSTIEAMKNYEVAQSTLTNLRQQLAYARSRKPSYKGKSANNPWVVMEHRLLKQIDALESDHPKPSLWIDQESLEHIPDKITDRYHRYKARNIRLSTTTGKSSSSSALLTLENLSLGYGKPLFRGLSASLSEQQAIRIHGRNGAGKTTLIRSIVAALGGPESPATTFGGRIQIRPKTTYGLYQQEIAQTYLQLPLADAIERLYQDHDLPINDQQIRSILSNYLFDPVSDALLPLQVLSGGQKARFQIISMLAGDPNVLILDEPTNHLDLPSIEELEKALQAYSGALLFVSHDSYFVDKFNPVTLTI